MRNLTVKLHDFPFLENKTQCQTIEVLYINQGLEKGTLTVYRTKVSFPSESEDVLFLIKHTRLYLWGKFEFLNIFGCELLLFSLSKQLIYDNILHTKHYETCLTENSLVLVLTMVSAPVYQETSVTEKTFCKIGKKRNTSTQFSYGNLCIWVAARHF